MVVARPRSHPGIPDVEVSPGGQAVILLDECLPTTADCNDSVPEDLWPRRIEVFERKAVSGPWTGPRILETTEGAQLLPENLRAIELDGTGKAVAAWFRGPLRALQLVVATRDSRGSWTKDVVPLQTPFDAVRGDLAGLGVSARGDAILVHGYATKVFPHWRVNAASLVASVRRHGKSSWARSAAIAPDALMFVVRVGTGGRVAVTWVDPKSRILARTGSLARGVWGRVHIVGRTNGGLGSAYDPNSGVSPSGRALVLWTHGSALWSAELP